MVFVKPQRGREMVLSYCFKKRACGGFFPHPCRDRPYGRRSLSLTELWSVRFNKRTHRSSACAQTIKKPPHLEKGAQRHGVSRLRATASKFAAVIVISLAH